MSTPVYALLSVALRVLLLTNYDHNDVLTGLLCGSWDGFLIHSSWLDDRLLEPFTLLQIIASICFDLSYRNSISKVIFLVLGGILGGLLSDGGVLELFQFLEVDDMPDTPIDFSSFRLPSLKDDVLLGYESDSTDSTITIIPSSSLYGTRRPSTRQSTRTGLTGTSRSRTSLPRLSIPTYKRNDLPILTTGTSEAAPVPTSLNHSYLPASGSFIPRSYPASPASSVSSLRGKAAVRDERTGYIHIRAESSASAGQANVWKTYSVRDSPVPDIVVVPPEEPTPAYSTWGDSQAPETPITARSDAPFSSKIPIEPPMPTIPEMSVINEAEDTAIEVREEVLVQPSSSTPPVEQAPFVVGIDVPPEDTVFTQEIDYVSEGTVPESVVSRGPRSAILVTADNYRRQAEEALANKQRLQSQLGVAKKQRLWAQVFALKCQIEEAEAQAQRFHAKAQRRYHAAHNPVSLQDTIDVHGLKPAEAARQVDLKLRQVQLRGGKSLRVIVGRGKHSKGGKPVLRPAVLNHITGHNFPVAVDKKNPGLLNIILP